MKKMLMSGKCHIGYCGELTPLYDSQGEQLHTGDLVQLSHFTKEDELTSFYGLEYICHSTLMDSSCDTKYYVMGIASEHFAYLDGEKTEDIENADWIETIVKQNHQKWRITKVKDWSETVDGEMWGSGKVRTVIIKEEF